MFQAPSGLERLEEKKKTKTREGAANGAKMWVRGFSRVREANGPGAGGGGEGRGFSKRFLEASARGAACSFTRPQLKKRI